MQLQHKKWLAALSFGALSVTGASAVQAQTVAQPYINVTVGAPLSSGVYGRIQVGAGASLPPLYSSRPVVIGRAGMHADPVYVYVPPTHRQNWARYCHRYNACQHPVYFVNGQEAARRYPAPHISGRNRRVTEPTQVHQRRLQPYAANPRYSEERPRRRSPERHPSHPVTPRHHGW